MSFSNGPTGYMEEGTIENGRKNVNELKTYQLQEHRPSNIYKINKVQ